MENENLRIELQNIVNNDERVLSDIAKDIGISRESLRHFMDMRYKNPYRLTVIKIKKFISRMDKKEKAS